MQYQVPQFIETEDKIVGPFTLRQFLYVGVAGVVCGICYFLVQTWLFLIVGFIVMGGALALSFLKVNGRPLIKVGLSAFNFYWKPQTYVWKAVDAIEQPKKPAQQAAHSSAPIEHPKPFQQAARALPPIEAIASGDSLHKSWESLQTGTPPEGKKTSDRQFLEKKMAERYQIFQRKTGDRVAARRVDYR
jgi:hypothetical protein